MAPATGCVPEPEWNDVVPGENGTVAGFSSPCWYTGKAMFEHLSGSSPVGLIRAAVGGVRSRSPGRNQRDDMQVDQTGVDNLFRASIGRHLVTVFLS